MSAHRLLLPRLLSLALITALTGCGGGSEPTAGTQQPAAATAGGAAIVRADGSSTVFPISEALAEEFQIAQGGKIKVTVGLSGTGGGFKKFCRGETDLSNASRPILKEEMEACAANGVKFYEIPVAYDAVTVVINPQNTFVGALSLEQLKVLWAPEAQGVIKTWDQIDPSWPKQEIKLYGAGADSGTFDYFTEAVNGKAKSSRGDYTASEDDNVLVQGVLQDTYAIGYFGYAYYAENQNKVKAVPIEGRAGAGAVLPSLQSVVDGSYTPLSRPLFVYVSEAGYAKPHVRAYVDFMLSEGAKLVEEVKFVPLPQAAYDTARRHLAEGKMGTVFGGVPETGITIEDLLAREASL